METINNPLENDDEARRARLFALAATFEDVCDPLGPIEEAYYAQRTTPISGMNPVIAYKEFKQLIRVVEANLRYRGITKNSKEEIAFLCFPDCIVVRGAIIGNELAREATPVEMVTRVITYNTQFDTRGDDTLFSPYTSTRLAPTIDLTDMLVGIRQISYSLFHTVYQYYNEDSQGSMSKAIEALEQIKKRMIHSSHVHDIVFLENDKPIDVIRAVLPRIVPYCSPECTVSRMRELEPTLMYDRMRIMGVSHDVSGTGQYRALICEALDVINLMYHLQYDRVFVPTHKIMLYQVLKNSRVDVETAYGVDREIMPYTIDSRKVLWWGYDLPQYRDLPDVASQESFATPRHSRFKYYPSSDIYAARHVRVSADNLTGFSSYDFGELASRQHYLFQFFMRSYCAVQSIYDYDPLLSYFVRPVALCFLVPLGLTDLRPSVMAYSMRDSLVAPKEYTDAQAKCQIRRRIRFSQGWDVDP